MMYQGVSFEPLHPIGVFFAATGRCPQDTVFGRPSSVNSRRSASIGSPCNQTSKPGEATSASDRDVSEAHQVIES